MSNRFYVNDVQIFGNNEMFPKTYEELKKQGAEWTEDFTFGEIEITDPQALMDAVEQDTFEYLKKITTENVYDEENDKWIKHKDFSEVHDKELAWSDFEDDIKSRIYSRNGEIRPHIWRNIGWWVAEKRFLTSFNLYQAIKNEVEFNNSLNKLVLKKGGKITACMY